MTNDKILVFIPCYNCEKQISRVLAQLDEKVLPYVTEVILVNNLSPDHTVDVAKEYLTAHPEIPCKIINNNQNYNLGGSHKVAFNYALDHGFDYVIVLHGDDQGNIHDFLPLLETREQAKYDCVLGARFMKGSKLIGYSKKRIWGNKVFNALFSIAVGRKVYDLGSGLNMYKTSMLQLKYYVNLSDALFFNDEMLLFSSYYKHNLKFQPITWREEDQVSNAKLFQFSKSLMKMAFRYRLSPKKFVSSFHKENIYAGQVVFDNTRPASDNANGEET